MIQHIEMGLLLAEFLHQNFIPGSEKNDLIDLHVGKNIHTYMKNIIKQLTEYINSEKYKSLKQFIDFIIDILSLLKPLKVFYILVNHLYATECIKLLSFSQ